MSLEVELATAFVLLLIIFVLDRYAHGKEDGS
jgi:hypothetical protein